MNVATLGKEVCALPMTDVHVKPIAHSSEDAERSHILSNPHVDLPCFAIVLHDLL